MSLGRSARPERIQKNEEAIINNRTSLTALHRRYPGAVMVMEVGMHSPWTSRFLKDLGHRVLVAIEKPRSSLWAFLRQFIGTRASRLAPGKRQQAARSPRFTGAR